MAQAPCEWTPPSTWMISPVVAGNQSDRRAAQARAAGSGSSRFHAKGARVLHTASKSSKPGMLFAAIVLMGPAAMRFTRMPRGPRSRASYRAVLSNAAFATPIQSYLGQATCASKSRPTIEPPLLINGRAAMESDLSE